MTLIKGLNLQDKKKKKKSAKPTIRSDKQEMNIFQWTVPLACMSIKDHFQSYVKGSFPSRHQKPSASPPPISLPQETAHKQRSCLPVFKESPMACRAASCSLSLSLSTNIWLSSNSAAVLHCQNESWHYPNEYEREYIHHRTCKQSLRRSAWY